MLRYGRVIGHLSKITRRSWNNYEYRPLNHAGVMNLHRCYSDTTDKSPLKPPGSPNNVNTTSTIPTSGCPIDPNCECPLHPSNDSAKSQDASKLPPVEFSKDDPNKKKPYLDWKYWVAALVITGTTFYLVNQVRKSNTDDSVASSGSKKAKRKDKSKVRVPADSALIPSEIPYVLIGGGTASFSAFRSIKSRDPTAKVLVITEEEHLPYMRPPLSKELWYNKDNETTVNLRFKQWNGSERSLFYEPPEFYSDVTNLANSTKGGVGVALGWKIKHLDVANKTAILEDGHEIKYEKCLLATGASPKNLAVFEKVGDDVKDKIIAFRSIDDFIKLKENIRNPNVKNIVVIGGGFLGSEIACSLARNMSKDGKNVYQIYKEKHIMAQVLPEYLGEWTTAKAALDGVKSVPGVEVKAVDTNNGNLKLILTDGSSIDADQVIVAVGAAPNTELARTANLEVDAETGGLLVNAELEARSNLWVAGDAASFYDVRLGRRRVEHHDHAVISGRLAGENMTGAGKPYLHQSMFWSDLGPEVGYEAIGIIDSSLPTVGIFAKTTKPDAPLETVKTESATTEVESTKSNEATISVANDETKDSAEKPLNDFEKGVIFYLRDNIIVGILLWNVFSRMSVARQVLASGTQYEDLNEVAKLFAIHED